jgi:hypothetical protein
MSQENCIAATQCHCGMMRLSCLRGEFNATTHLHNDNFVAVRVCEFFELWRDHLAWAAPGGMEIDDDQLVSCLLELSFKIGLNRETKEK